MGFNLVTPSSTVKPLSFYYDSGGSSDLEETPVKVNKEEGKRSQQTKFKHLSSSSSSILAKLDQQPIQQSFQSLKEPLNHILTIGLKGVVDSEVASLFEKYGGMNLEDHAQTKLLYALALLKETKQDQVSSKSDDSIKRNELIALCKHRRNFLEYVAAIKKELSKEEVEEILKKIQEDIDCLESSTSSRIVALDDGSTRFAIPGAWREHTLTYEFRKKGEDYFFVIHNRGDLAQDSRLHGPIRIENGEKIYRKTVIVIKTQKKYLLDKQFLKTLIENSESPDAQLAYDCIYNHFILSKQGQIIKSENESLLENLQDQIDNLFITKDLKKEILKNSLELMKGDPHFNSQLLYSSCSESNITTFEKPIASHYTRRALKKFTLKSMISHLPHEITKTDEGTTIISKTKKIIEKLEKEKLTKSKPTALPPSKVSKLLETIPVPLFNSIAAKSKIAQIMALIRSSTPIELFGLLTSGIKFLDTERLIKQCKYILNILKNQKHEEISDYRDLEKITDKLNCFLNYKQKETFDVSRQVKNEFAIAFDQLGTKLKVFSHLTKLYPLQKEIMKKEIEKILSKFKALPKETLSSLSQVFWIQSKNQCLSVLEPLYGVEGARELFSDLNHFIDSHIEEQFLGFYS